MRLRHRLLSPAVGVALGLLLIAGRPASGQGLRLLGLDGGELSEATLAHGAVVVVVWASWSPRCRDIVPRVNAIVSRWGGKARVVTVNFQEERPVVESFLATARVAAPVFLDADGAFSKKHAVTTLPSLLVFRGGRADFRGRLPDDPDAVLAGLLD